MVSYKITANSDILYFLKLESTSTNLFFIKTFTASESLGKVVQLDYVLSAFKTGKLPGERAVLTVARVPKLEFLNASNSSVILEAKA